MDHSRAGAAAARTSRRQAEEWRKGAHDAPERAAPPTEQAQAVWRELRHDSNVDLGAIRLFGSATRRSVDLLVQVDGSAGDALGQ
jgi:hypothetical protein